MKAHLGNVLTPARWLFDTKRPVSNRNRAFLLSQLMGAPSSALMGSFCALIVLTAAAFRQPSAVIYVFVALEITLAMLRLAEWRLREGRFARSSTGSISVDATVMLSLAWCALQGAVAFTLLQSGDPALQVLSTTLVLALIGPICARNYAAPRFAMLLVLICDLPFKAGALLSGAPLLWLLVPMTPPFLLGSLVILKTFHNAILSTLEAEEENRRLATHDSLTKILNRQGMDEALDVVQPDSERSMAILSIDLDGFKQINDTHGHGAGDVALIEVAKRLTTNIREDDLVARMGGDEFMVVLFGMTPDAIQKVAATLVHKISDAPITISADTVVPIGASIGFACFPQDARTTLQLRLLADRALYDAKEAGKGQACRIERREPLRFTGS